MRKEIEPRVQRMIDEGSALMDKVEKLHAFMLTETFTQLAEIEQGLLSAQWNAMKAYADILSARLHLALPGDQDHD